MTGRIAKPFIQDILARIDIVDIIRPRISMKKRGANYLACCPFHQEKTPSFTVNPAKQFYYCFGCNAHGNALGFLMAYDKMEFVEAVIHIADQLGIEVVYEAGHNDQPQKNYTELYTLMTEVDRYYQKTLRHSPSAINYLKSRGLTGAIAKQYGIGYAPPEWENLKKTLRFDNTIQTQLVTTGMLIRKDSGSTYDRFRDRIMFPIRDTRGRVIAFGGRTISDQQPKYLNSPETPIFHKSNELYGLYEARKHTRSLEQLLVVEGYMDVVSLAQQGIQCAVATLGTAVNIKHIQKMIRYCQHLVFCFDGDNAGKQAAWKALIISLPLLRDGLQIQFLFLPETEDPDSMVQKIGKDAFIEKAKNAKPLADVFFETLLINTPINSLQAKAEFAKKAATHLNTMPQGIYQTLLFKELAAKLSMPYEELQELLQTVPEKSAEKSPQRQHRKGLLLSPCYKAIALLLQYPKLAQHVQNTEQLIDIKTAGISHLLTLIQHLKQHPNKTAGQLMTLWDNQETLNLLAQLAAHPLPIPEEGLQPELDGAIERLLEMAVTQETSQLLEKSKNLSLNPEEKLRLIALQKSRAKKTHETLD